MTSESRAYALYNAVRYVAERPVRGNFVESGVWQGGSAMLIALTLMELGVTDRHIWLFDTFAGMPEPEPVDRDLRGVSARELMEHDSDAKTESLVWAICDIDTVRQNMISTGYPEALIHLIKGDVCLTAQETRTGPLAILRLDTDFHKSTKVELDEFWPRLVQHGVLLVDDYGHWNGSRVAVDEFFGQRAQGTPAPVLLQPIDYTGRIAVRSESTEHISWRTRYDYRPAELNAPDLLADFPYAADTDPATCRDPRLRKESPHIWRTDAREPKRATGILSIEEACLLYALAKPKAGRRALEIGSHFGWSTAHIAAAGLPVDAIDPAFGDAERGSQVGESLDRWGDKIKLWPGYSPGIVDAVAATSGEPFAFAFVDGQHSNGAPLRDVQAILPHLADDGVFVFHDMTFSDVAAAVRWLKGKGWSIRLYNTMQVMAAAWQNGPEPVAYGGDPAGPNLPEHLRNI